MKIYRVITILFLISFAILSCAKKDSAISESLNLDFTSTGVDLSDPSANGRGKTLVECNLIHGTSYITSKDDNDFAQTSELLPFGEMPDFYWGYKRSTIASSPVGQFEKISETDPATKLPYQEGESYSVTQGHNGEYSHTSDYSKYALDFEMPECTRLVAVADGKVVATKKDSNRGGGSSEYGNDGNYVWLQVGTDDEAIIVIYYHLCKDCVVVTVGQDVVQGELLGLSGNTGWSTGPHLHIQMNDSSGDSFSKQYIHQGGTSILVEDTVYTSTNTLVE